MRGYKRWLSFVVVLVLVGGICVGGSVGITAKAITPNFINNLSWYKGVSEDGIIGYSCHDDYEYCYVTFSDSNRIAKVYGANIRGSDNLLFTSSQLGSAYTVFGCAISNDGAFLLLQVKESSGYSLSISYYNGFSVAHGLTINCQNTFSTSMTSSNYQFVISSGTATGFALAGFVGNVGSNGVRFVAGWYYSPNATPTNAIRVYNSYSSNPCPTGAFLCGPGTLIDTSTGTLWGLVDGMSAGSISGYYQGDVLFSSTYKVISGTRYYYGVRASDLSFCQIELVKSGDGVAVITSVSMPAFFAGTPQLEEGASSFPIMMGFSSAHVCFWYGGAKTVYSFNVELLPSDHPTNFWDWGGKAQDIILDESGLHISFTADYYDAISRWHERQNEELLSVMPDFSDMSIDVPILPHTSDDIGIGELVEGIAFIGDRGNLGLSTRYLVVIGMFTVATMGVFMLL